MSSNVHNKNRKRFVYKRIPVYDSATSDLLSYAPIIVSFISTALHHGSVLVHCQRGISRSTTAVLFYLMGGAGMTYQEGIDLCKRRRPEVDPIPAFVTQLKVYERRCREMGTIRSKDDSIGSVEVGNREGRGMKRKASRTVIGPVRVARGPARRPTGISDPVDNIIGPNKNDAEVKYYGDCSFGNPKKKIISGPSPLKPPCKDDVRTTEAISLSGQEDERKKSSFGPQKKT